MIVLGLLLIILTHVFGLPGVLATLGWLLLVVGVVLLVLSFAAPQVVGGRRFY